MTLTCVSNGKIGLTYFPWSIDIALYLDTHHTPGIYAEGYIVFAFPFVGSFVGSFVSSFVIPERSWNLCQSFC